MKAYKTNLTTKIFFTSAIFLFTILGVIAYNSAHWKAPLYDIIWSILALLMCVAGIYNIFTIKIIVDDEKIEYSARMLNGRIRRRFIFWNEIIRIDSGYWLYPEMVGWVTLIPDKSIGKKSMNILIPTISLNLLKDILAHISPEIPVYIYPYLKRKLEGKQTGFYIK